MRTRIALFVSTGVALLLTLAACGGGGGSGRGDGGGGAAGSGTTAALTGGGAGGGGSAGGASASASGAASGTLTIQVTDAPFAHGIVDRAEIEVSRFEIHEDATATSGFTTIFDASLTGRPLAIDLTHLRNGTTLGLLTVTLPAGTYRQLRYVVSDARLALTNGNVYSMPNGSIELPSATPSGFSVFIDPPVQVRDGQGMTLLLDFDLSRTYLPIPAGDALAASRYMLRPVVRAAIVSTGGSVQGTVRDAANANAPVASASIEIFTAGTTTGPVATTGTDSNGSYAILAVPPGSYDVVATITTASSTRSATVVAQLVTASRATMVDIQVP
jgi:hypothetical protein